MLVCHCNVITRSEIETVVRTFLEDDAWAVITPLRVYHALERQGRCCGCFPNAVAVIVATVEAWHRDHATPEDALVDLVARLKEEHEMAEAARKAARLERRAA
ncbi:(2Fe-2S)-binding protein [Zhengella mangrovi]|uniref:(2Fe-2S)-binding protein n=1 Tax=Zhengella mangrovi TaxID=1982044 RepID=A0A2G1QT54_9HYPH|nr:(2Fe-2S)-binding protein [Zhengella mangrovi]PHP68661.1 (2Fe-2S)-binding protein [Zhengella mangrovi]